MVELATALTNTCYLQLMSIRDSVEYILFNLKHVEGIVSNP